MLSPADPCRFRRDLWTLFVQLICLISLSTTSTSTSPLKSPFLLAFLCCSEFNSSAALQSTSVLVTHESTLLLRHPSVGICATVAVDRRRSPSWTHTPLLWIIVPEGLKNMPGMLPHAAFAILCIHFRHLFSAVDAVTSCNCSPMWPESSISRKHQQQIFVCILFTSSSILHRRPFASLPLAVVGPPPPSLHQMNDGAGVASVDRFGGEARRGV
ncbi:hypothetical protein R3P38DRAFT_3134785 [Favolaschia claudopus]|uniref:Secreted protein n=1 Tax=Favolaschia claudopus TaxID=2862362 RepID=A0AAV9Z6G5_9AGAR